MMGAREFAKLFGTEQHGRLYLVSGSHARGLTFQIFVLPEGIKGYQGMSNAVEVYGIVDGQPGWTESYGWLYKGKWVDDFYKLVAQRKQEIRLKEQSAQKEKLSSEEREEQRKLDLLKTYE